MGELLNERIAALIDRLDQLDREVAELRREVRHERGATAGRDGDTRRTD